ncbi:unnamed protein product [Dovyalis caffra]|uniref:Uncharacterized protein n=1 Tax=Dovyalis caffra TaxID=77055 RepID=A0AAV1S959_9ROSI|nr:unnamed protein product [Dovyalis caffra]
MAPSSSPIIKLLQPYLLNKTYGTQTPHSHRQLLQPLFLSTTIIAIFIHVYGDAKSSHQQLKTRRA